MDICYDRKKTLRLSRIVCRLVVLESFFAELCHCVCIGVKELLDLNRGFVFFAGIGFFVPNSILASVTRGDQRCARADKVLGKTLAICEKDQIQV